MNEDQGGEGRSPGGAQREAAPPTVVELRTPLFDVARHRQGNTSFQRPLSGRSGVFTRLRLLLIGCDALAIMVAYTAVALTTGYVSGQGIGSAAIIVGFATAMGIVTMRSQELYLSRVSTIRALEVGNTARAMVLDGVALMILDRIVSLEFRVRYVVAAVILSSIVVTVARSAYRTWITAARRGGRYRRRVLLVGADHEARRMYDLFECHRETGVEVVGLVGRRDEAVRHGLGALWRGELESFRDVAVAENICGVIFAAGALNSPLINSLVRSAQQMGLHVQLATGVSGVEQRRVRTLPVAYEPMIYVEPARLARAQVVVKRVFDLVLSSVNLVLTAPLIAAIAIAIKLDSPGPVFFKQERVGYRGRHFRVYKFRTMVIDAERLKGQLAQDNARSGPLFKMANDPRVTRVGRLLRLTSLDELPQLFNVLRGEMSLVGPRPALPDEVARFPAQLRAREQVVPGLTGLWQVEARDNPSFDAYARLDLFYVENWSLALDLAIILGTLEQIASRLAARRGEVHHAPGHDPSSARAGDHRSSRHDRDDPPHAPVEVA